MVYDSGTIEADREIMMMPIPNIAPAEAAPAIQELPAAADVPPTPQPELPQPTLDAETSTTPEVEDIPPVPAEPVLSTGPAITDESAEVREMVEEPISSSDSVLPTPEPASPSELDAPPAPGAPPQPVADQEADAPTVPAAAEEADAPPIPQPNADPSSDVSLSAPFTYDFAADNSQTIEFGTSDANEYVTVEPSTVLSDFDVQLDGVGLIE